MLSRSCLLLCALFLSACTTDPKTLYEQDVRTASTPLADSLQEALRLSEAEPLQLDPGLPPEYRIGLEEPRLLLHGLPSSYRVFRLALRAGQPYTLRVISDCVSCAGHTKYGLKPALFLLDEQGQVINDTPSQGLAGMRGVSLLMSGVAPRDGDFFLLVAADNRDLGQEIILDQLSDAGLVTAPRRGTPMRSYPIGEIRAYGSQRL